MTTIAFIRHGETDWNMEKRAQGSMDIPLNEEGIKQAKAIAARVRTEKWDAIYASPLSRAYKTAEAISELTGLNIVQDDRLREISFGDTEGTTEAERLERWGENWKQLDLGKERDELVDQRWQAVLQEIVQTHKDQRVLIVTHGALLVRIYKSLLEDKTDKWYGLNNTSLSIFKFQDKKWSCELFNCHKHLEEARTI
ncbi:histidine phosphatase family protein [Fictibacillus phosphorivorans]|uniref:histidine phosphatase family protein n=1 Tax=Fictibacillus phosphorivorans TaxID=1221500 RepID=UPI00204181EE|nr:histidine phosphatase family protein [Fictibacillus phosphorivorans]MCM3775314.1 histidine phosphatase family protein [Fictibacillus phosphorivorans]